MSRPQPLTAVIALALAASAACNRADTAREAREAAAEVRDVAARAGDRLADSWLTAKVQGKFFADDQIKARYIDVTARDGTVTLKGFVESDAIRQQAVQIARTTEGVQQVQDQLLIGQAPATAGSAPGTGAVATSGSTAVTTPLDSRPLDDSMVVSLIQARYFVEPNIKMRNIDVTAANGVVTLRGQVASDHERAQALLLARTSHGVERVEDHLTVDAALGLPPPGASTERTPLPSSPIAEAPAAAPGAPAPAPRDGATPGSAAAAPARESDAAVERSLKAKLNGDAQLKAAGLEVSARDGVVMLQGTVPSQAAKQRALTMAREAEGAVQVVDRLSVGRRP
jgi:osmotically-inducible protein OsmY